MEKLIEIGKMTIKVQTSQFNGKAYLDVRKMYVNKAGELKPTRKGISLELANGEASAVLDAMKEVYDSTLAE